MSDIVEVNASNFEAEVLQSTKPVIVDFSATWCGPCKRQLPILEKFAAENVSRVKVCKVDVDDSQALCQTYSVRGVPAILLFVNGVKVDSKFGMQTAMQLDVMLANHAG